MFKILGETMRILCDNVNIFVKLLQANFVVTIKVLKTIGRKPPSFLFAYGIFKLQVE